MPRELPSCQPVLFAYALDTPVQREALQEEILDRITAIQELYGTLSMAQLDDADPRSHFGMAEAVALLSRDVRGPNPRKGTGARIERPPTNYGCPQSCRPNTASSL